MAIEGGCYCGSLRYRADGDPQFKGQCHCRECQFVSGGGPNYCMGLAEAGFEYTLGSPKLFSRSDLDDPVTREFCGECGTPLTWEGDAGGDLGPIFEIHLSTFDDPNVLVPTAHAFYSERISWFDIADKLPRFEGAAGQTPPLRHGPEPGLN